jgi:pentatricopeptide repeat protein
LGRLLPSYGTYQRLVEVYLKHNEIDNAVHILELMQQREFDLNETRTKWTLMNCYVSTEDPRVGYIVL